MQHARFYVGLMIVSIILPSSSLKAGSFDKFAQQHVSNPLDASKNQSSAGDQTVDASQDASKNSEQKNEQTTGSDKKTEAGSPSVAVEAPKPYTAAELFAARNTTAKKEELIQQTQKEEALSAKQFNSLLQACMSHGKTKEECLFEAYNEAVKLKENAGSFIIAKEILAEKNASELKEEKAKLKKAQDAQNKFYLKVAGGVVVVACLACGYGGYTFGSHVKPADIVQPLTAEQTREVIGGVVAPLLQAIQALSQAAAPARE